MLVILVAALLAWAQTTVVDGLLVTGRASGAMFRPDAQIEIWNSTPGHALLSIFQAQNPTTNEEAAIALGGYNSASQRAKMASVSGMFSNNSADNGYGVLRLNAAYRVNGVERDDVAIRVFGGKGIQVFAESDRYPAGYRILNVKGRITSDAPFGQFIAKRQGSDIPGNGPFYDLHNASDDRQWLMQLGANTDLSWWYFNGQSWKKMLTVRPDGSLVLASGRVLQ